MDKLTNKEVYENIVNSMPEGMRAKMPSYEKAIEMQLINIDMNDFIQTLTNKIGKMLYIEQHFNNPYDRFYYGEMPFGYNVEQLFSENQIVNELIENSLDLFNSSLPNLKGIVSNNQLVKSCKINISYQRLKSAFYSENGLINLINNILENVRTSMAKKKYDEVEKVLNKFPTGVDTNSNQLNFKQPVKVIQSQNIVKDIIKTIEDFTIPSTEFNPSKYENQCLKDDILVLVKSDTYAELMSNANKLLLNDYNIISVKSLPTEYTNLSSNTPITTKAVILDKRILPILISYNTIDVIENPNKLELEYYYVECFNLPINTFSNYTIISE